MMRFIANERSARRASVPCLRRVIAPAAVAGTTLVLAACGPSASSPAHSTPSHSAQPATVPPGATLLPTSGGRSQGTPVVGPTKTVHGGRTTSSKTRTATAATSKRQASPRPHVSAWAPAHSSYTVGAYYFSGWSHGPNNNLTPLLLSRYPQAEPLIGWYDDSQSQVDKSIGQAADAGIDFFAFDWYDTPLSKSPTDKTLNEGLRFYLSSSQRHRVKFCLVYIDQAPFLPTSPSRWSTLVKRWIPYLKEPGYMRVNGKPLFIVFSPEHLLDVFKSPTKIHKALDQLRGAARAAGLPGVTIAVAATIAPHSNPARVQELRDEGYDVATGYNYHSLGDEHYRVPSPYADLVSENVGVWDRVGSQLGIPYMPVVTSGWDQRYSAREQKTAIIYAGRTPQAFACFAGRARHWIDTHSSDTTSQRIVMLFAWNEIGEGGAIIPSKGAGYAYANAIKAVFGGPGQAPQTLTGCT